MSPRLYVFCGLPGTGKTTQATRLAREVSAIRFCPDDWFRALGLDIWDAEMRLHIEATHWALAQELLAMGVNVIIEFGSWAREERDVLREGARSLGVEVELRFLDGDLDELYERVTNRGGMDPPMTRENFDDWNATIQRPTPAEFALFDPPLAQQ